MKTPRLHLLTATWLLGSALPSCAHKEPAKPPPVAVDPAKKAEEASQKAFQQAAQVQQEVAAQQTRLDAAHKEVVAAQQRLAQAQVLEEQERSKMLQLQQRADIRLQEARRGVQEAQSAAEQAQGVQTVVGQVKQATSTHVVLQTQGGQAMMFVLDRRTRVMIGTEQRSVADIQQGADAQVAYEPGAGQPTALSIRLTPVGE